MAVVDTINRIFREFFRYTGDDLPNPPIGAPLPVGDPSSGVYHAKKSELRTAFAEIMEAASGDADAAKEALAELERLYLGAKATDPSTDNEGQALQVGALYFNTSSGKFRVWNGTAFQDQSIALADGQVTSAKISESPEELEAIALKLRAITTVAQDWDEDEQAQARANIGAAGLSSVTIKDNSPAYIEQLITMFHGRGMLTAEPINVVTEQAIAGTQAVGSRTVAITNATNFRAGGNVTIKHDNGRYWSYFITAISGNTLSISNGLLWPISALGGATCERTWWNRAHPGKYAMRQIAQRVAYATEREASLLKEGRSYYSNLKNNDLITVSGAALSYFAASSSNTAQATSPARFIIGRSAFVDVTTVGQGVTTAAFAVPKRSKARLKVVHLNSNAGLSVGIRVVDNLGNVICEKVVSGQPDTDAPRYHYLPFDVPPWATTLTVQFIVTAITVATNFVVDEIEVGVEDSTSTNVVLDRLPGSTKVVVTGDSWAGGDLSGSPQREPISQQLQIELPYATVVNTGVGGRRIWELNANFQTAVAQHAPDYVVVSEFVNEAYNPSSGTIDPTAANYLVAQTQLFIASCMKIGAKPILLGVPGLAESDTEGGHTGWSLNATALIYNERLIAGLGRPL